MKKTQLVGMVILFLFTLCDMNGQIVINELDPSMQGVDAMRLHLTTLGALKSCTYGQKSTL